MKFLIVFNCLVISISSLPFTNTVIQSNRHTEEEIIPLNSTSLLNLDDRSYKNQLPMSHDNGCEFWKASGERMTHLKYILTYSGSTECHAGQKHRRVDESSNDKEEESMTGVLSSNTISKTNKTIAVSTSPDALFNSIPNTFKLKLLIVIHRLEKCNDTGTFDLDCYKETKSLVNKIEDRVNFFNNFRNYSPSDTILLQKALDLFHNLEDLTRTLCSPFKAQRQYCFFFDFESYAREVEEFYRSTRKLLQILIHRKASPKPVLKAYQTVLEQKFRRYKEIISVETDIWNDRLELEHLKQLNAGAAKILGALRRFWNLKNLNQ